ncbi:MAG: hypothetical protein SangKO_094550 [Sandaracinaceae bacterium]|jgi:hypothetical protein|nr:hypothetical protein [Myxococcales bacterium]
MPSAVTELEVGARVHVVPDDGPRPLGGEVFWIGPSTARDGIRVGVILDRGAKVWLRAEDLRLAR